MKPISAVRRSSTLATIELDDDEFRTEHPPLTQRQRLGLLLPLIVTAAVLVLTMIAWQTTARQTLHSSPRQPTPPLQPSSPPSLPPPWTPPPPQPSLSPTPPRPSYPPLSAVDTWRSHRLPLASLSAEERVFYVEPMSAAADVGRLRARVAHLISDWPRIRRALSTADGGDFAALDAMAVEVCATWEAAIPVVGLNGVYKAMGAVLFDFAFAARANETTRGLPLSVDGIAAYDWLHGAGALGLAYVLRAASAEGGTSRAAGIRSSAVSSAVAMAARATWWRDLRHAEVRRIAIHCDGLRLIATDCDGLRLIARHLVAKPGACGGAMASAPAVMASGAAASSAWRSRARPGDRELGPEIASSARRWRPAVLSAFTLGPHPWPPPSALTLACPSCR